MRAVYNGVTIARSDDTIVVEGNHYFPLESVDPSTLSRSQNAAWTYRHPYPWIRKIKNHVAFWNGVAVRPD